MKVKHIVMLSGGMDSTYIAWKMIKEKYTNIHLHHISIRNDVDGLWIEQDLRIRKIVDYLIDLDPSIEYSESAFEFFGMNKIGFDSDLILLVAQKLAQNFNEQVDVLIGWNPHDMQRLVIADRAERNVTGNIWKALIESTRNRDSINKELQFPLIEQNKTKTDIMREMPEELLNLTWSCRRPLNDKPCTTCHACQEIEIAYKNLIGP